jgi:hypothetical protein
MLIQHAAECVRQERRRRALRHDAISLFDIVDCRKIPRLFADLFAPAEQVPGDLFRTC